MKRRGHCPDHGQDAYMAYAQNGGTSQCPIGNNKTETIMTIKCTETHMYGERNAQAYRQKQLQEDKRKRLRFR